MAKQTSTCTNYECCYLSINQQNYLLKSTIFPHASVTSVFISKRLKLIITLWFFIFHDDEDDGSGGGCINDDNNKTNREKMFDISWFMAQYNCENLSRYIHDFQRIEIFYLNIDHIFRSMLASRKLIVLHCLYSILFFDQTLAPLLSLSGEI